jgi:transcriptional regulator with XRE-family HTH domain
VVQTFGSEPDPRKRIRKRQGKAIRTARELKSISIDEFATALGVTPGAVSQWETGRFTPRQHHQVAIAKAVDMPWSFLFGLDGEAA